MKRDSFRLSIPKLLPYVQEMYQRNEIDAGKKDAFCRYMISGDTKRLEDALKTMAFFGSRTAERMLSEIDNTERRESFANPE